MPQAAEAEGAAAATEAADARTEASHERVNELTEADVRDLSAKMVDLRGLVRPAPFTGDREDWPEFRFKLES
eukprot:1051520-Heterocapsa_arctica.AAC.1